MKSHKTIPRVLVLPADPAAIEPPSMLVREDGEQLPVMTAPPGESCPVCGSAVERADDPVTSRIYGGQRWIARWRYRCGAAITLKRIGETGKVRWGADAPCRNAPPIAVLQAVAEWARGSPLGDAAAVINDILASHGLGEGMPLPPRGPIVPADDPARDISDSENDDDA
jgi:hypothetical protein